MVAFIDWVLAQHIWECAKVYRVTTINSMTPTTEIIVCAHCANLLDISRNSRRPRTYHVERRIELVMSGYAGRMRPTLTSPCTRTPPSSPRLALRALESKKAR